MFKELDMGAKSLLESIIALVYYMKGSVQYEDMMYRTPLERSLMEEFLVKKMERENKEVKKASRG
jgi:hypothetical protein